MPTAALIALFLSAAFFTAAHEPPILLPHLFTLGIGFALIREFHHRTQEKLVTLNRLVPS